MLQRVIYSVLFGVLLFAVASCRRDDDSPPDTNMTSLVGSWRERYQAPDANENGVVDSNERTTTAHYRVITFYANGSFRDTSYINNVAANIDASYTLAGQTLNINFPGIPPYRVVQLDATTLILRDTSARPQVITGFSKQ